MSTDECILSTEPSIYCCLVTVSYSKFMEKLDKMDKWLRQFPYGKRAVKLARKIGAEKKRSLQCACYDAYPSARESASI